MLFRSLHPDFPILSRPIVTILHILWSILQKLQLKLSFACCISFPLNTENPPLETFLYTPALKNSTLCFDTMIVSKQRMLFFRSFQRFSYIFISKFLRYYEKGVFTAASYEFLLGMITSNSIISFSLLAVIVPPCSSTISFAIASPKPAPPLLELRAVSRR